MTRPILRSTGELAPSPTVKWRLAIALLVAGAIVTGTALGRNGMTASDPKGTLLVSQAIVEHGTIRLDGYPQVFADHGYRIVEKNGHFYYYFPLGTPLAAAPLVAALRPFGANMAVAKHERNVQLLMAALVLMASYMVLRRIAALYLPPVMSAVAASSFLLGSSFISTGATALWSHDFAALFALLVLHGVLAVRADGRSARWPWIALWLFLAYLCRPTLLLLTPVAIGVMFAYVDRRAALKTAGLLAVLLAVFVGFSWSEFHQPLPDYYLPQRLGGGSFWTALYGNLVSPSRGVFIYAPFLLLPVLSLARLWRSQPESHAELWLAAWPLMHLLAISNFPHWWAGYSFGPRLMYDALPGLFVLFVVFLRDLRLESWRGVVTAAAVLVAIAVNFGQGMFNRYAGRWNAEPHIDRHPELLFDWKYPQFLHSEARHLERLRELAARGG